MDRRLICQLIAWALSLLVAVLAVVSWGNDYDWQLFSLSIYQLFPLLGLLAFSIMWSHYAAALVRQLLKLDVTVLRSYFQITSLTVLVLLCLHPGLLIFQRLADGYGLPPGSLSSYVGQQRFWLVTLGLVSLLVFLIYELHRWYKDRSWWPWVVLAGDLAMLAVFYHGLRLGSLLSGNDWYLTVWWFYGLSLGLMLIHKYLTMAGAGRR